MRDQIKLPRGWTKAAKENPQEFFAYLIHSLTVSARSAYPRVATMPDEKRVRMLMKVNEQVHQISGAMDANPLNLSFLRGQLLDMLESGPLTVDDLKRAINLGVAQKGEGKKGRR
jgi:hypothetical protein